MCCLFCFLLFLLIYIYFFLDNLKIRLSKKLSDRCVSFYQMDVFLAGTTGHVLKPEPGLFFRVFPLEPRHCTNQPSSSAAARSLLFCLSDLRRQSDETLSSERRRLSLGLVPILHYNHPLSPMQRDCRSSLPLLELIVRSHDLNLSLLNNTFSGFLKTEGCAL